MFGFLKSFSKADLLASYETTKDTYQLDLDKNVDLSGYDSGLSLGTYTLGDSASVSVSGDGGTASAGLSVTAYGDGFASASGSLTAAVGNDGSSFASADVSATGDVVSGSGYVSAGDVTESFSLSDFPTVQVPEFGTLNSVDIGDDEDDALTFLL